MLSWIPFPLSPPLSNGCLRTEEQPDDGEAGESKRKRRIGSLGWSSSPSRRDESDSYRPTPQTSPQSPRLSIDVGAPSSSQETADSTTPPPSSSRVTADVTTPPNRSKPRLVPRSARAYGDEVENTWREDRAFQEFLKEILTTSETLETLARRAIQLGHPAQRVLLAIRTIRLSNASSSPTLDDLLLILSHPVLPTDLEFPSRPPSTPPSSPSLSPTLAPRKRSRMSSTASPIMFPLDDLPLPSPDFAPLDDQCRICFGGQAGAVLKPCGHEICEGCAETVRGVGCPFCRRGVLEVEMKE